MSEKGLGSTNWNLISWNVGWGVGCGVWGVGCGVWGVGCGVWGVGVGMDGCESITETTHRCPMPIMRMFFFFMSVTKSTGFAPESTAFENMTADSDAHRQTGPRAESAWTRSRAVMTSGHGGVRQGMRVVMDVS